MYRLKYTTTVIDKDIPRLSADVIGCIKNAIEKKLRVASLQFMRTKSSG